ncbi:MAG: dihydrodipicolinate synthase family protein [Trueperaceae bacterium]|nr:MAG: dihydrodipicolinate synthase family protein [Trueperaceae bacterium]
MARPKPSGIFPAIPIPFASDWSLDEAGFRQYLQWISQQGVQGLVTNGHTGEISSLSREERRRVTAVCVDEVGHLLPVYSGISAEGTIEAVEHAQDAQAAGAKGILLMPPHNWLRFGTKPEAKVDFFRDVAAAIDIDIIVHLYPAWTKTFYTVDMRQAMGDIDNVVAIKDGTREMAQYQKDLSILKKSHPDIAILTCHDEYLLPTMIFGIDGALVGFGSLVPELITGLWKAVQANDIVLARRFEERLLPLKLAVYGMGEPSGDAHARLKEALVQRGLFPSARMRPPVPALTDAEKQTIADAFKAAGVEREVVHAVS